jgi:hypothetical protein
MSVEDQLREAGRAVSDQVRDLPSLDLRTQPAAGRAKARASRRWLRGGGWLVPIAAAAAVVAVAATLVAVRNSPRAAHQASAGPAVSPSAGPASSRAAADAEALPGYFVAISGLQTMGALPPAGQSGTVKDPRPDSVVVGETLTGKRLATVTPPTGDTFVGVTGAADDRTFVLDSVQLAAGRGGMLSATQERTWYLLRVRPGATPVATVTRINFPVPSAADINGIALSPDGTKLAMFYQVAGAGAGGVFPYSGPFTLAIYSVATGAVLRSWTGSNPSHGSLAYGSSNGLPDSNTLLTWTSDGQRLAFDYRISNSGGASLNLREVDLAGPGGDLLTASTVIAKIAVSPTNGRSKIWCDSLGITGDGQTALCGAELPETPPVGAALDVPPTTFTPSTGCPSPTDTAYPGLAEVSLSGDTLARVLYEVKPGCVGGTAAVLWSSPTGDTVLGAVSYVDGSSKTDRNVVVLYRHGTASTINWPGAGSTLLGNEAAF